MRFSRISYFFAGLLVFLLPTAEVMAQPLEEFNGPFPSWANIKTRFGAKGNGKDDDTRAIQAALDSLGVPGNNGVKYTVLFFPKGSYCISSTIVLRGKIGVCIAGENPVNTIIKWVGADGYPMFWANGSAFYKVSRFTWDANKRNFLEGIGIHWKNKWNDGQNQSYASLNIEISDNIFTGGFKYGISGGTNPGEGTGNNDSEIAIKRCMFENCTGAGITTTGYNALDYWIWDCRFLNCFDGIDSKYGNFHAYRSYFRNSLQADAINTNGFYKSMRGCYSEGSNAFALDLGYSINPFKRIYQANTVIKPKAIPIQYYHQGRLFFIDNLFDKSTDTSVKAFVKTGSNTISINNSYGSRSLVNFVSPGVFQQVNDKAAAAISNTGASFLLSLDKTPVNNNRQVFEVPPGADDKMIQQIIYAASKLSGKRPVVHFAAGTYIINQSLLVPAGADMQLLGDGCLNASVILPGKNFPAGNAYLKVAGPSSISIRELQMGNFTNSKGVNDAIRFENADQQDARTFVDQLYTVGNNAIRAEGIDYLYIQKDNSFFADNDFISGGPKVQKGTGTAGLFGYGGQFAGIHLQNNATAVYKDCWWEGADRIPLRLSGNGNLTIDGAMIAPNGADSNTTIAVNKFKGNISLVNMYMQGGVDVSGDNPELKLLLMNIHFSFTLDPLKFLNKNASFRAFFTGLSTQCFNNNERKCDQIYKVDETNHLVSNTDAYTLQMLADDRNALPKKYEGRNKSASNIFISRVSLGDVNNALKFTK